MNSEKCPFCEMGQAKRMFIWRLTRDMSRQEITDLLKENKRTRDYICYKCGKNCGNAGLLAMHLKSPGRSYRQHHREFEKELNKGLKHD